MTCSTFVRLALTCHWNQSEPSCDKTEVLNIVSGELSEEGLIYPGEFYLLRAFQSL